MNDGSNEDLAPLILPRERTETKGFTSEEGLSSSPGKRHPLSAILSDSAGSGRERDEALAKEGVGAAAFLIRDAVLGYVEDPAVGAYDPYSHPEEKARNGIAILCRRLCAYRPLVRLVQATAWILVFLTFIEAPHWCRSRGATATKDDYSIGTPTEGNLSGCRELFAMTGVPADNSTKTAVEYYPNSNAIWVTVNQSRSIEWAGVGVFFIYTLLRIGRDGMSLFRYLRKGPSRLHRVIQLLCLVLLAAGLSVDYTSYHPFIRLLLLMSLFPGPGRVMKILARMSPRVFRVLTMLFVVVVFYAWFGCVMFVDTTEGTLYFNGLLESLWTLYIAVTTANYPDVMMPAYNENRWVALYFVSFMLISVFFFMNVVLASVVNHYDEADQEGKSERAAAATTHLKQAYQLLDEHGTGHVDRETVMALFCILNEDFPELPMLSHDDTELLFAILDKDGSSTITEDEFMNFGSVLLLKFTKTSEYATFVERAFPGLFRRPCYQRFCQAIKSDYFEKAIDFILVLNAFLVAIQTYPELSGHPIHGKNKNWTGSIDTIWEVMETAFTGIYVLEVILKVNAYGWKAYKESPKNMFDFFITVITVVASAVVYYPNRYSDVRLIRMIVMARVMRLIRLLDEMKGCQVIGRICLVILPDAANVVLLLFYLTYIFAALGLNLYGGMITRDPANPLAYLILNTDFVNNEFWASNFNDMFSAMIIFFNLLVVGNWTEYETGFEAVTQSKWVRFFFLAFHIAGVVFINNLVIAIIINNFFQQLAVLNETTDEEVVEHGETVIRDGRTVFHASTVTGTKTSLTGSYYAQLRSNANAVEGNEQDPLSALFLQGDTDAGTKDSTV